MSQRRHGNNHFYAWEASDAAASPPLAAPYVDFLYSLA
jgi:hypothetical protein